MHLYNLSQHFILLSYILTYIQHHNSPSVSTVALTFPLFSAWRLSQSTTGVIEAEWTARYTFYVHILDVTIWPFGRRCLWCCRISKTVIFPYSLIFSLLPSYMYSLGPVTWYGHISSTVPHGHIVFWTCSNPTNYRTKVCPIQIQYDSLTLAFPTPKSSICVLHSKKTFLSVQREVINIFFYS